MNKRKGNPYVGGLPFFIIPFDTMKIFLVILLSVLPLCCLYSQKDEQGTELGKVINTLKERITLEGYAQLGYTYDDSGEGKTNSFDIKRVIFMAHGKITDHWSCYFMYSFANTGKILEAYTEYRFLPELTARVGQFKTMFTIENPMSPCVVELINVYSQATNYLAGNDGSDPLYGSNGGRDMGLMLYGDLFKRIVSYKVAVMNGQGINRKDGNNQKDVVGNLVFHPLQWLSVGGSFIKGKGCAVAESSVNPDISIGESYDRNRWAAGAQIKLEQMDLRAEYMQGKDGRVRSNGYYITSSAHVLPRFDVILSYDYFNKSKALEDKQSNYVAGVQWRFYPKCRLQVQYTYCDPHLGKGFNLLQTQLQVRF